MNTLTNRLTVLHLSTLVAVLAISSCAPPSEARTSAADAGASAMQVISPEAIEAHIRFLADDLLEGRYTGQRGYDIAARYVVAQFRMLGLAPAGVDGTYYQPVAFRESVLVPEQSGMTLTRDGRSSELVLYEDYVLSPTAAATAIEVSAPLAFVGYGVSAPDLGHDDYAGIDVEGKVVAYLSGAPESFPSNQRAYYSSGATKREEANSRGAVAVVSFTSPDDVRFRWDVTVNRSRSSSLASLDESGEPLERAPAIRGSASLNHSGAAALFAGSPVPIEDVVAAAESGTLESFDLPSTVTIRTTSRHSELASANVVARLPGSDPSLADEHVVYVAHIDGLGMGDPVDGDGIYNGAHDDASGVAIMIEVARAFTTLPEAPRRSVVFLGVTGEERGLLGSDYFARNPTVPGELVANFSLDMPFLFHPLLDIVPYGAEHSTMSEAVQEAAEHLGIGIGPDPIPEQVLFIRSDHFSFIRQGVPALFIKSGFETGDPSIDGAKINADWRVDYYHRPSDEADQAFDFGAGVSHGHVNFLTGYLIASADERPRWNEGDFFGGLFGRAP